MTLMKDSATFLDDMVAAWLRREDSVDSRSPPTWRNLVKALRHERVKQTGIANTIENECLG